MGPFPYNITLVSNILISMVILEAVFRYWRGEIRSLRETTANLAVFLIGKGIRTFWLRAFQLALLQGVSYWVPWNVSMNLWTFFALLILVDFLYYVKHYVEHFTRFFWSMHCVHHSSDEFNLSTALRLPWIEGAIAWVFFLPAIALGFEPIYILVCYQLVLYYQFWVHCENIPKLGWFEKYFNTASHHRVHHGSNPQYIDKNLGGILIVWDRIFGTFEEEQEAVKYGLTTPLGTANPFRINFDEQKKLAQDMLEAKSVKEALALCYRSPAYVPKKREPSDS